MALNLTRGGLSPAKLTNLATNEDVRFMFNPYEYSISKQNSWEKKSVIGQNIPEVTFQQGGAQTLSLTLHFDSSLDGSDVRNYTNPLWKMMLVDTTAENPRSGKSAPPPVAFQWGRLYFKAIITSMTQKFTLFAADGTPTRAQVDISLEQFVDNTNFPAQTPGATGGGQNAPRSTTYTQGERLDNVSASSGGSGNYRDVAEQNNIDNPLKVRNGQSLKV
jgi:hypothetical protein